MNKVARKYFVIALVVVVFFSTNGIALSLHYCLANSSKSVSIFISNSCCKKGKKCSGDSGDTNKLKTAPCCNSTITFYKLDTPFEKAQTGNFFSPDLFCVLSFVQIFSQTNESFSLRYQVKDHPDPPLQLTLPLLI